MIICYSSPRKLIQRMRRTKLFKLSGRLTDFTQCQSRMPPSWSSNSECWCALLSCSVMSNSLRPHGLWPIRFLCPWSSSGKKTGVGCHTLLQRIFPIHGLNPDLLHCRRILYCLNHQGSPWILEWIACPFSRESSQPRNWTRVFLIVGRFFTTWATRKAPNSVCFPLN